ncbi:hypothetical protein PG996_006866 [Apiospora saccharicola]|uniref:Uncharacterized protein n=1 Tax=Apiospora saccharicola TaxID=335842 RepID=A0ABR1V966_9PEZI
MTGEMRLVPDVVFFSCGHEKKVSELPFIDYIGYNPVVNNPKLVPEIPEIFESLVVHDLVEPPGEKASLIQVCPHCVKKIAFANRKGDSLEVVLDPLRHKETATKDRVSLMLIFRQIWYVLTQEQYLEDHWFTNGRDGPAVFRLWCWRVVQGLGDEPDRNARTRLLAVINDLGNRPTRIGAWTACGRRPGRRGTLTSSCTPAIFGTVPWGGFGAYPVDLSRELDDICRAGSSWSAELLGPPTRNDLRLEVLKPKADKCDAVAQRDIDQLLELIGALDIETIKFKVRLFRLFKHAGDTKALEDWEQVKDMLDLVESLEVQARVITPLEESLRKSWDAWVEFAKPFADLLRVREPTSQEKAIPSSSFCGLDRYMRR